MTDISSELIDIYSVIFSDTQILVLNLIIILGFYIFIFVLKKIFYTFYDPSIYTEIFWGFIPRLILIFIHIPRLLVNFYFNSEPELICIQGSKRGCDFIYRNNAPWCEGIDLADSIAFYSRPDIDLPRPIIKIFPLWVPIDLDIRLFLRSLDSVYFWSIPEIGVRVITTPGVLNFVDLKFTKMGTMYRHGSEVCGNHLRFIPYTVKVVSLSDYLIIKDKLNTKNPIITLDVISRFDKI